MTDSPEKQWTLADELCKIARAPDVAQALYVLGFLSSPQAAFHLADSGAGWVRGGAETYIYRFSVTEDGNLPAEALIKACVAYAPGGVLEGILQSWIERRQLLSAHDVSVPKLYGWGHGVIIEEFVAYELRELLQLSTEPSRKMLDQLALYAAVLSKLGFAPVGPFNDLRSHGDDVVAVDFGQDLGPAGVGAKPRPQIFSMLCDYFKSMSINLPADKLDELEEAFTLMGGELFH